MKAKDRIFFKNNYKTQIILLVRQRLKLIYFGELRCPRRPGNRVHWTQFLHMEIESNGLDFCTWKSNLTDSIFVHGNQAQSTRFSSFNTRTWNHQEREHVNELTCSVLLSTKQSMWVEIKKIRRVVANIVLVFCEMLVHGPFCEMLVHAQHSPCVFQEARIFSSRVMADMWLKPIRNPDVRFAK